jgi:uncharacterized protein
MDIALTNEIDTSVAAGPFGSWLEQMRAVLRGEADADVPCGDCVGCCVSSYPVPVRPEDRSALAAIPVQHLANTLHGQTMMVARADGTCPMLDGGKCSIYTHRPQTCRDYDCRIFAAAGISAGGEDRSVINRRVDEWQFSYTSPAERAAHEAVQCAARFIKEHPSSFPSRVPTVPTGIAVLAIKVYEVFMDSQIGSKQNEELARLILEASRAFDLGTKA